jgi:hypothetical protein
VDHGLDLPMPRVPVEQALGLEGSEPRVELSHNHLVVLEHLPSFSTSETPRL